MSVAPETPDWLTSQAHTELGLTGTPAADTKFVSATAAALVYVIRAKGATIDPDPDKWEADHRLGTVRLAVGLYRDANKVGIAEPFANSNAAKRATDIQIEQLLQIGRHNPPMIG